ncbi:MAG: hypothetical protein E6Q97_29770 [Desulfurellales bacterium]|nr:MAG: hypothetical protein E6Q97_29770 [Desulfurellales bacterium]
MSQNDAGNRPASSDVVPPADVRTLVELADWLGPRGSRVRAAFCNAYCEARAAAGTVDERLRLGVVRAWDGGFSARTGKSTPCAWRQLLTYCEKHAIDPVMYAAYIGRVLGTRGLGRENLFQPGFLAAFRSERQGRARCEYADTRLQTYIRSLEIELGKLRHTPGYTNDTERMREALACVDTGPPLFRYCVAVRYGVSDVADALRARALLEYRMNRELLAGGWAALIPAEWRSMSVAQLAAITEAVG